MIILDLDRLIALKNGTCFIKEEYVTKALPNDNCAVTTEKYIVAKDGKTIKIFKVDEAELST